MTTSPATPTSDWDRILAWTLTGLFLITPLLVTTNTAELFEFPKMIFVYLVGAIVYLILSSQFLDFSLSQKDPKNLQLPHRRALFVFAASALISTVLSIHRPTSVFGYYKRFNGGLASLAAFLVIYLGLNRVLQQKTLSPKKIITAARTAALITSVYAIAQHFGLDRDVWIQDPRLRAFATLGQPNWLAAYLTMLIPLFITPILLAPAKADKTKGTDLFTNRAQISSWLGYFIVLAGGWFTYSLSGILGLLTAGGLFLVSVRRQLTPPMIRRLILIGLFSLVIVFGQPGIFKTRLGSFRQTFGVAPSAHAQDQAPPLVTTTNDTARIRRLVWQGTLPLITSGPKQFLFGSGPETFAYIFPRFRSEELNHTSEAGFLFNKPHNWYLEVLVEQGGLGLLAFLGLLVSFVRSRPRTGFVSQALFAGWFSLLVTSFFGWPTVTTELWFWTGPLLWSAKNND